MKWSPVGDFINIYIRFYAWFWCLNSLFF